MQVHRRRIWHWPKNVWDGDMAPLDGPDQRCRPRNLSTDGREAIILGNSLDVDSNHLVAADGPSQPCTDGRIRPSSKAPQFSCLNNPASFGMQSGTAPRNSEPYARSGGVTLNLRAPPVFSRRVVSRPHAFQVEGEQKTRTQSPADFVQRSTYCTSRSVTGRFSPVKICTKMRLAQCHGCE